MAKLEVPPKYRKGAEALGALDDRSIEALKAGLEHAPESISPRELAVEITSSSASLNEEMIEEVIRALRAFHSVRNDAGVSLDVFAEDLVDALKEEQVLSNEDADRFLANFRQLMEVEHFALCTKARDLQRISERLYCRARIVTDLRPMFGDQPEDGPKGLVILHHLRIGYHEGDRKHKDFHVTMDSVDLERLRTVIDRALEKGESLKEHLTSLPYFGIS